LTRPRVCVFCVWRRNFISSVVTVFLLRLEVSLPYGGWTFHILVILWTKLYYSLFTKSQLFKEIVAVWYEMWHHTYVMIANFRFFETRIVIHLCNKNQQNAHFLHWCFNLIVASSTCFEHPGVHPQEDLYMLFYGISFMHPYKQSGRWLDVLECTDTQALTSNLCILLVLITQSNVT